MKLSSKDQIRDDEARSLFRPGIYLHHKGDEYAAVGLVRHHDTRRSYVLYNSLKTGAVNARPLVRLEGLSCPCGDDHDAWQDSVDGKPRFRYLRPLP